MEVQRQPTKRTTRRTTIEMADEERKKVDVSVDKIDHQELWPWVACSEAAEVLRRRQGRQGRQDQAATSTTGSTTASRCNAVEDRRATARRSSPLPKALPAPFSLAYKKRTFSPNRIKYPMKRVDWDPDGERNTQKRGKSKYKRISWDEATDIIAAEIRRIHKDYGPLAILAQGDGHGECKTIHTPHGHQARLLDMMGGFTQQVRNPDSWEGWYWGAKHVWGQGFQGMMSPAANLIKDISENCDMVLKWGCDEETTPWGFTGQYASRISQFWTRAGIKQVYICPDLNYAAAVHADKWIPILPNTDAALQLAIIYMWLNEGHLGQGIRRHPRRGHGQSRRLRPGRGRRRYPQDPGMGIQEVRRARVDHQGPGPASSPRTTTSIIHYFGGSFISGPYSHEPARLECVLLGMQGLGGPGVHQCQMTYFGMPRAEGLRKRPLLQPRAARASHEALLDHGPRLGPAAHPQDPHPGRHPQAPAGLPRQRRPGVPDRGAVHQVHLPDREGKGRRPDPHDVDRHPVPHHLLEPRQLDHRGHAATPASSASSPSTRGSRTTACTPTSSCRPTPPSRWRTSSPPCRQGPHFAERLHPGAVHPADRRVEERLRDRPRDRREAGDGRAVHRRPDAPRTCRRWSSTP